MRVMVVKVTTGINARMHTREINEEVVVLACSREILQR